MGAVMIATPVQELKALNVFIGRLADGRRNRPKRRRSSGPDRRERTDDGVRWRPSMNVTLRKID